jgi:hypothetical protein
MSPKPQRRTDAQQASRQPAGKGSSGKEARPPAKGKPPKAPPTRTAIPDEASIKSVSDGLRVAGQQLLRRIVSLVAAHLGSPEAARLWLVTPAPEFGTSPLSAIEAGRANLVLAVLESLWGPSPNDA